LKLSLQGTDLFLLSLDFALDRLTNIELAESMKHHRVPRALRLPRRWTRRNLLAALYPCLYFRAQHQPDTWTVQWNMHLGAFDP